MGLMSRQAVRPKTWSALRERANSLGMPAWLLAEDLGIHELLEEKETPKSVKVEVGGMYLDARDK